ncbi:TonB-dependent receptor [Sphingomonas sp. UYEF23]|uniref:TonB-dependent receptor n=1 Tax=Sphingomonas sp. UYEF23 TaxID=1756408 RepID=UPI003392CF42
MNTSDFLRLMATTALITTALPAMAQTEPAPAPTTQPGAPAVAAATGDQAPADQLQDIIVTANRVESSAQKTATALTVYSGADLAAAGVTNVTNLQRIDPSVNIVSSTGAAYVAIRGIASTDVTEIGDPSVPIARDGFFTNRSFSIATSIYDLQRVEVLKGPQGTLFGRNSTGGLISLITRRPGKDLGGNFSLEAGNYKTVNAEAGIDIPLASWAQLRLSGVARRHDGYRELLGVGGRGDDDQTTSGRVTLAVQPFAGFDGMIQYQHDDINNVGDVAAIRPIATILPTSFDEKQFVNYAPTFNRINGNRIRWEFSYDRLPLGLTLTYAGGYDSQQWRHALDASGNAANPVNFRQAENPDTWNHEVRLATPQGRAFSAQVGYFHFDESNSLDSGLLQLSGQYAGQYLVRFRYNTKTSSDAVFGQASLRVTDTLKLTAGARYTWDKKDRTGTSQLRCDIAHIPAFLYPIIGCLGNPPILPGLGNGTLRQQRPTFLGGIDWTPTDRNLVYAKYSSGYKSGGFNSNGSAPSVDYGPENVYSWEIGTKNRFADRKLQLNADIFYQNYKGYQASQASPVVSSGSGVFNIGSAKIYGAEAQFIALFGAARLDLNGTYLHAQFDKNIGTVSSTDPVTGAAVSRNVSGNDLPNAPRFALTGGLEYRFDFANGATLTPRVDGKYSTAYYYSVFNDADTRQTAYATGNAQLTYAPAGGHLQISAFVRNFTDKAVFANATRNFTAIPSINTYQFQPPRTYGMRLSFKY